MTEPTYIAYVPRDFMPASLELIGAANAILERYERAGRVMSLRQLYYQLVTMSVIPNSERSYSRLGSIVNDGRLAGLMSWTAIEDRGRQLRGLRTHGGPADAVRDAAASFLMDLWVGQPFRPEVWVEKDSLVDVVASICNELRVDFFSCHGYNSQSEAWAAGQRFAGYVRAGQRPIVFHLGDHDPSGLDMTRDNRRRLEQFAGVPVQVVRLALNHSQVAEYALEPNYAKITDSRAEAYVVEHGTDETWELDALSPEVMHDLIRDAVLRVRDNRLWSAALAREASERDRLDLALSELSI